MTSHSGASDPGLAFDAVPETYDRIRPTYPEQLFAELFSRFEVPVRVLEIGAGTGKATGSLLAHGARVLAVEPGPRMAAFLREKFSGDARLEVVNAKFEEAEVPGPCDVVFAATSFHWVDPAMRLRKAHDLLRAGGGIAILSTNQVKSDADRGYFEACQPIYRKYFPDEEPTTTQTPEEIVPDEFGEIDASDLFSPAQLRRYRWDQTYTSARYADLLRSYSGTNMMAPDSREGLVSELCALADRDFGGVVTRPLVITLTLAFRA